MSNQSPTDPEHNVTVRVIDWNDEIKKIWGQRWNEPEVEYEFSNKRVFKRRTQDAGIYNP